MPGETVHEWAVTFTLEDAKASLFESTYSRLKPIYLESSDGVERLPVVLDLAQPMFVPAAVTDSDTPAGCYEQPEWCFRGWVVPSGYSPSDRPARVWIWVAAGFNMELNWQVIPEDPPHDEPIRVVVG
jgi:hypothetical protein